VIGVGVRDDGTVHGAPRVYVEVAWLAKQAIRRDLKQGFARKGHYFSMIECWN